MDGTRYTHASASGRRSRLLVALLLLGVLLILTLLAGTAALAGPKRVIDDPDATPSWGRHIPGPGADMATDVLMLGGGVTLMAGTLSNAAGSTDISLTKLVDHELAWTRTWNGAADGLDTAKRMALSPDGKSVYIEGTTANAAGTTDIVVIKRSVRNGNLRWAKRYNGPARGEDIPSAIGVDRDGNVVVCGGSEGEADMDWVVVSWSSSGARRWAWRFDGGHGIDQAMDLVVAADGRSYVGGSVSVAGGVPAATTARINASGGRMWLKQYLGPEDLGGGVLTLAPRPGGGVYVAGTIRRAATGLDGMLLRYNGRGRRTTVALDTGAGPSDEVFNDIAVCSTGAIVAAASSGTIAAPMPRVVVYRPDGSTILAQTEASMGADKYTAAAADAFGGWYVAGTFQAVPGSRMTRVRRGSVFPYGATWRGTNASAAGFNAVGAICVRDTSCAVACQVAIPGPTGLDQLLLMYIY